MLNVVIIYRFPRRKYQKMTVKDWGDCQEILAPSAVFYYSTLLKIRMLEILIDPISQASSVEICIAAYTCIKALSSVHFQYSSYAWNL